MNVSKFISLIPLVLFAFGSVALSRAQAAGPVGGQLKANPKARQPVVEALQKVGPTADEKPKLQALFKTRNENVKVFRDAHKGDTEAIKTYLEAQQKELLDGIKGVLSTTQWDQFQVELKKIMADIRATKNGANPMGSGSPPPASSGKSS